MPVKPIIVPVRPIFIPNDVDAKALLAYIEIASELKRKTEPEEKTTQPKSKSEEVVGPRKSESGKSEPEEVVAPGRSESESEKEVPRVIESETEEEFLERRDDYYKQIDERAKSLCDAILEKIKLKEKAKTSKEKDKESGETETSESGEADSPLAAGSHKLFQYFARQKPVEFKQICATQPKTIIQGILGDNKLAETYINNTKDELIDEALIAIFNYKKSVDQFIRDMFYLTHAEQYAQVFGEEDDYREKAKHYPSDANYKEWLAYQVALREIAYFSKLHPTIDIGAALAKRHNTMKKKYNTSKVDVENVYKEIDVEIKTLLDIVRKKVPSLKALGDHTVLYEILQKGKSALRSGTYINNDPELQNVFLQLKAFKQIRDSNAKSSDAILIATDNIAKEIMQDKLYQKAENNKPKEKPSRFLHILSITALIGLAPAIYSYAKNRTIFYANDTAKRIGLSKKTNKTAAKSIRNKTENIYKRLKK